MLWDTSQYKWLPLHLLQHVLQQKQQCCQLVRLLQGLLLTVPLV
jgi:hypothetical protein